MPISSLTAAANAPYQQSPPIHTYVFAALTILTSTFTSNVPQDHIWCRHGQGGRWQYLWPVRDPHDRTVLKAGRSSDRCTPQKHFQNDTHPRPLPPSGQSRRRRHSFIVRRILCRISILILALRSCVQEMDYSLISISPLRSSLLMVPPGYVLLYACTDSDLGRIHFTQDAEDPTGRHPSTFKPLGVAVLEDVRCGVRCAHVFWTCGISTG